MSASEYLEGCGFFAVMLVGSGLTALFVARLQPGLPPAARVTQVGVLWLCAVFAVHLVPGMLGLLDRWGVAGASVALAAAAYLLTRTRSAEARPPADGYPEAPESGARSWLFAAAAAGASVVMVVTLGIADALKPPFHVDVVSFHLPNVARWIQSGTLWQVDDFIPDRSPGNYPQTGDVFSLAAMLPWSADFLVRFVNYPLLLLLATGTFSLVRELRVPGATAAVTTSAFVAAPVVSWVAFAGLADIAMLACFAAGVYFLLRHQRTGARMDLVLAGLALGLSFGTRWYAVPAVTIVVGVWLVARLTTPSQRRSVLSSGGLLVGLIALAGGFWLVRNWVESGNPVFPVKLAPLGITIFDAPRDVFRELEGFTIAGYADEPSIWREYFLPSFLRSMGVVAVLLWAGLAAAGAYAIWLLRRARKLGQAVDRRALVVVALVAAAALIGLAYALTPYSATGQPGRPVFASVNSRYVLPALVLGVATTGWLIALTGRWRQSFELVMLVATLDGIRRSLDLPGPDLTPRRLAVGLFVLGVCALAGAAAWALRSSPRYRTVLAGAVVVAVAIALTLGWRQQRSYLEDRYAGANPPADAIGGDDRGRRIGFVGEGWGNYMFFGRRLRNDVRFVGRRVGGTYRNYGHKRAFDAALRRGRYHRVVFHDFASIDRRLPKRQERWLRDSGYTPVAQGRNPYGFNKRVTIYRPPPSARRGERVSRR